MSAPPSVRLTGRDESAAMSPVLTDAFVDEAGLNYWLKQGREKETARRKFFDAIVEDAVHPERDIYVAEGEGEHLGAALWLKAGKKAFDLSVLKQRGFALADKLETYHPKQPHAHLVFLGVATKAQGRGVGSELLKHTLAPLDASGKVAYLECSTERNVALYQRHGFEVTGEFGRPNVHMWTMARQPRR
jgi:ribosomal protein S18 acetylase RimI-like enzyme